jgi:N6-adenosine-specific RNA methylase IME4
MKLIKYDAACKALAVAVRIDEAKNIRDRAEALKAYARQVNNRSLEADAWEIRERAVDRMNTLHQAQPKAKGAREKGTKRGSTRGEKSPASLKEQGINKDLAKEMRRAGKLHKAGKLEAYIAAGRKIITSGKAKVKSAITTAEKAAKRKAREQEVAARIIALPERKYGVIYADPEYRFEPWSRETGMDRAADNHYSTSELEDLIARNVASIAATDCVIFLWATAPMLPAALEILRAWGFEYRSQVIWHKIRPGEGRGTGYWFINEHEILLVGVRGNIPAPAPGTQYQSVVAAPVGEHSAKPEIFLEMIEAYFPNLPKIELNRRGLARAGWDAWGAEALAAAE